MCATIKKYLFCLITGLLISSFTFAQDSKYEFHISGNAGLSLLKYDTPFGDQDNKPGGGGGLGFTFFFAKEWGVMTGTEIAFYRSTYTLNSFRDKYISYDYDSRENFEFNYTINQYKENQRITLLQIPLMIHYRQSGNKGFYAAAGAKVGIPIQANFKSRMDNLKTSGYYPDIDVEFNDPTFIGFGEFSKLRAKEDYKFKTSVMVSAEVGRKWKLMENMSLYTGVYIDCGLNDILKDNNNNHLVGYNTVNPDEFLHHGVLNSDYTSNGKQKALAEKLHPLSFGLKVRLSFSKKRAPHPETETATDPVLVLKPEKEKEEGKPQQEVSATGEQQVKPIPSRKEIVEIAGEGEMRKYCIILGSFSDGNNAVNFKRELEKIPDTSSIILRNESGLFRVAINCYDEEGEARFALLKLREAYPEYESAWLLITE